MQTKLVRVGNSFGVRLPKTLVNQYNLENSKLEIIASDEGILLKPTLKIPPLAEWDKLFNEAKKNDFNAIEDREEFKDWDNTLQDGEKSL